MNICKLNVIILLNIIENLQRVNNIFKIIDQENKFLILFFQKIKYISINQALFHLIINSTKFTTIKKMKQET